MSGSIQIHGASACLALGRGIRAAVAAGLTPPSLAPVLSVTADLGSYVANLTWTASNKTGSTGFGYEVWGRIESGSFALLSTTTDTFYDYDALGAPGTYEFYVIPINSAGEGPSSNTASVVLPGESETQFLLLEDGTAVLLEDATELLLEAA